MAKTALAGAALAANRSATDIASLSRRVAERYRTSGRFHRIFVGMKLRQDPVYPDLLALAAAEPLGDVVDVGCGRGQLGMALLEAGLARSVLGLDWNAAHVAIAQRAGRGLAFAAGSQDLTRDGAVPAVDTVILVDVLYQLDTVAQSAVLEGAARAARSRLLIRTADPGRGLRSALTRWLEVLGRRVWPNSGARVNAQPVQGIEARLAALGFDVEVAPCWRGTPFANVLIVARRRDAS